MANTKISQLPQNNNPTGSEELVYAFNNSNGKMTLNTMKNFATNGLQPELVSWTNIKTINWNDILWSWNIVISGGGGWSTWTISLNALENIAAWTLVSFNGTWVKKLRRWFYGTANTWVSLTISTQQENKLDSVAVTDDTTVVVYENWSWMYVVAIKWDWETRTVGTPVQIPWTIDTPKICSPYEWEFVVAYSTNSKVQTIAWSVSWTTITLWTWVDSTADSCKQSWLAIIRRTDTDTREYVLFYTNNTDGKLYYNICSYSSALVVTPWTEAVLRADVAEEWAIWANYFGEWTAWIIREYKTTWTYYTDVIYIKDTTWATLSWSNYKHLYESTSASSIWWSPRLCWLWNWMFVADTWATTDASNSGIFLIKGGVSSILIQRVITTWQYPIDWRSYCNEWDWILWMFYSSYDKTWKIYVYYAQYKCTDAWIVFVSLCKYSTEYGSKAATTVARIWNTSCCTFFDQNNNTIGNLLFQDESNMFLWINDSAATSWSPVDITYSWVATTSWLTAWLPMYIWLDWAISQTWEFGWKEIWIATGSTDALLK